MRPTSKSSPGSLTLHQRCVPSASIVWLWPERSWVRTLDPGLVLALLRAPSSECGCSHLDTPFLIRLLHRRKLAHAYPDATLSVTVASNNEVFESDIYAASHINAPTANLGQSKRSKWGGRAVLVLIGIRLGIDGVNPLYYDGLKVRWL